MITGLRMPRLTNASETNHPASPSARSRPRTDDKAPIRVDPRLVYRFDMVHTTRWVRVVINTVLDYA
jgi:hypothetical protein